MKYSDRIFGNSEISLRLPNLLMLLVYFIYTYLILRKSNPVLCIAIFILMATNTALIDFFGLARGYGMSVGFMIMSLYHLMASFHGHRNVNLILFNIGALLAILSNFTMLSFYLSALLVFNMVTFAECRGNSREKFNFFRINKVNIVLFFLLFVVLYEPVRKAVKFNTFNFGGKQGFVTDTVSSLIYHMFMNVNLTSIGMVLLQVSILLIVIVSSMLIIIHIYRSDHTFIARSRALIMVNLIILSISFESIIQHYILKTDYLIGRFSLFLFPLFILNLGFLFEYLVEFRIRFFIQGLAVSLAILSVSNFYLNRNLYACAEWGYDMETKNAVAALMADRQNNPSDKQKMKMGINWLFEPTINFYRQTQNIGWLLPVDRNGLTECDDYDYIFNADSGMLKNKSHSVIFSSEKTNTVLIRNIK